MGTNSSKNNNGSVIKTKVRAVGKMSLVRKQTSDRRKEIEELKKKRGEAISVFEDSSGEISREDLTSLPLKNGDHLSDGEKNDGYSVTDSGKDVEEAPKPPGLTLSDFKKVTRKKTLEEIEIPFAIPYEVVEMIDTSHQCHVCEVFTGHEVYPCRICGKAYHKSCLQKLGHCQGLTEVALLHSAKMPAGWTCYICNDLSNLLTEEELTRLMTVFEEQNIQKGLPTSKDEFMKFARSLSKNLCDSELSDDLLGEIEFKFDILDYHKTGAIPWHDFLNYQTIVLMEHRKMSTLVPFLTSREVELARRVFHKFDKDHTGKIPSRAAKRVLHAWYKLFYTPDGPCNGYALLSDDVLGTGVIDGIDDDDDETKKDSDDDEMDDDDLDSDETLSWDDYLSVQAIHSIAIRPNKTRVPVGDRTWLEKVIISYNHEATLSPDNDRFDAMSDSSGLSSASLEQLL